MTQQEFENSRPMQMLQAMTDLHSIWSGFMPPGALRRSEFELLIHIGREDSFVATVSSLAREMRQSVPAISQKVRDLEQAGYVVREQNQQDKRTAALVLTPKGDAAAQRAIGVFHDRMQSVLDTMGEEKARQLLALLLDMQGAIAAVQKQEENDKA